MRKAVASSVFSILVCTYLLACSRSSAPGSGVPDPWKSWAEVRTAFLDLAVVSDSVVTFTPSEAGWVLRILESAADQAQALRKSDIPPSQTRNTTCAEPDETPPLRADAAVFAHVDVRLALIEKAALSKVQEDPGFADPLAELFRNCAKSVNRLRPGPDCCAQDCQGTAHCSGCMCVPRSP